MAETVVFRTTGEDGDERLIREYVFDVVERLPSHPGCEGVGFNPFARKAGLAEMDVDGGVLVRFWGDDVDAVVDRERERWDALVEDGVAESWEWSDDDDALVEYMGEQGAERYLQFQGLATRLSKLVYEEFRESPDPVDDYPAEERAAPAGVGWWRLLHLLTIQQNYRYGEEIDAFVEGIRSTVETVAQFDDHERALRETDEAIASLQALRADLEA
jgi:hypothetical protein